MRARGFGAARGCCPLLLLPLPPRLPLMPLPLPLLLLPPRLPADAAAAAAAARPPIGFAWTLDCPAPAHRETPPRA